ncbi:MAG: NADH-quinone oxidoreductase subunit C [Phycisphaerales bacterium]|nr:NADH-quinone oxidoreductase subunit C [Phycisphaerales bacterium]
MAIDHPAAIKLKAKFPGMGLKAAQFRGDTHIIVPKEKLTEVVSCLKSDSELNYNMLADVSAVDYLNYPGAPQDGRYGLLYVFNSVPKTLPPSPTDDRGTKRLILRVFVNDGDMEVDSLVPLYAGAEWLEREVFDMFGIKFKNHPDLRRILTWDSFQSHPLRKDYPVTGKGEREQYPVVSRDSA